MPTDDADTVCDGLPFMDEEDEAKNKRGRKSDIGACDEQQPRKRRAAVRPGSEADGLCDLVLVGDYWLPSGNWKGEMPMLPIAMSEAIPGVPQVRVFSTGNLGGSKYWELPGSAGWAEKVEGGAWLPSIVAKEMHERVVMEGLQAAVPRGEFIEEACNEAGESILVVDAELFRQKWRQILAVLTGKRLVAGSIVGRLCLRFVRERGTRALAARFCQSGVSFEEAQCTSFDSFDSLSSRLSNDTVVDATGSFLRRIIALANWRRVPSSSPPVISGAVNVKVFLAAYMFISRPSQVFETVGEVESKLLSLCRPMIEAFHSTARELAGGRGWKEVVKGAAKGLHGLLGAYIATFKDWKLADEGKIAGRVRNALKGLEGTELALQDGGEDCKLMAELRAQQQCLRDRLAQIANSNGRGVAATPVEAPSTARSAVASVRAGTLQPGHVEGMTNEQLAHELLLDKDFKLHDKAGMTDDKLVHTKIRETFEKAFWESLADDLSTSPPSYGRVLTVLTQIRTGIESMASGHAEAKQIADIIDVERIKMRLCEETLDYEGCQRLMGSIVGVLVSMHGRMKNTERRHETSNRWEGMAEVTHVSEDGARSKAMCVALQFVLDRVHAVTVDTANNKLKAIAPVVRQHGVDYERGHFFKRLESGLITLDLTKAWISHTVSEIARCKDVRVDVAALVRGKPEQFEVVLYIAIVNLMADYPHWGGVRREASLEDVVPETMKLDLLRIRALNAHFHTDVVSSIILVTAEQQCRELVKFDQERARLVKAVQDLVVGHPPKPSNTAKTIRLVVAELEGALEEGQAPRVTSILIKNVERGSAVYVAMTNILKKVWFHLIRDQRVPATCLLPECARPLVAEVERHSRSLASVALLNKMVHAASYNDIITKAAGAVKVTTDGSL